MLNNKWIQASICLIMATVLGLTSHIYLQEWIKPILDSISREMTAKNLNYPMIVIGAAYATGTLTTALKVFFYYHGEHLLPKAKFLRVLMVTGILLEFNGELIRMPLMNTLVNYMDQWVVSFLIALCLVYLCPKKYSQVLISSKLN